MADATSVLEVDVKDEAFKAFTALFEKYQNDLAAIPGSWQRAEKAMKSSANPLAKINAIIKDTKDEMKKAATFTDKLRVAGIGASKTFQVITKSSWALAKNIRDITLNIGKWAALGLFSLAAGGFGLDRLGQAAGNKRREAQGLGITPGEHEAAKINFSKMVDVDSMLARIQEARTDLSKRWTLTGAGLGNIEGKSNADVLRALLPLLKSSFQRSPTLQAAEAHGLTQFGDIQTLTRLSKMTDQEIESSQKRFDRDKQALQVSDKTLSAWQNFNSQLARAGTMIENLFIVKLSRLTKPIGELSAAFARAISTFMNSGQFEKWIKIAGEGIEKFAKYIGSDKFNTDITKFVKALDDGATYLIRFGSAMAGVMDALGIGVKKVTPDQEQESIEADRVRINSYYTTTNQTTAVRDTYRRADKKQNEEAIKHTTSSMRAAKHPPVHVQHSLVLMNATGGDVVTQANALIPQ